MGLHRTTDGAAGAEAQAAARGGAEAGAAGTGGQAGARGGAESGAAGVGGEGGAQGIAGEGGTIDAGEPPTTLVPCPTSCHEPTLETMKSCVDLATVCAGDSHERFDAAKSRLEAGADGGAQLGTLASDFAAAQQDLVLRERIRSDAETALDAMRLRYDRARAWPLGVGLSLGAGRAAGGAGLISLSAPVTVRWTPVLEMNLLPGIDAVSGLGAAERREYLSLRSEVGFVAGDGTAVVLGGGVALRDEWSRDSSLLLPMAFRHRFGNALGCQPQLFSDLELFLEPWIPVNGDRTSVFFGLRIGLGVGVGRLGRESDLKLSSSDPAWLRPEGCPAPTHSANPARREP